MYSDTVKGAVCFQEKERLEHRRSGIVNYGLDGLLNLAIGT